MLGNCPFCGRELAGDGLDQRIVSFVGHMVAEPPNGHRNDPPVGVKYCPLDRWEAPGDSPEEWLIPMIQHLKDEHAWIDPGGTTTANQPITVGGSD